MLQLDARSSRTGSCRLHGFVRGVVARAIRGGPHAASMQARGCRSPCAGRILIAVLASPSGRSARRAETGSIEELSRWRMYRRGIRSAALDRGDNRPVHARCVDVDVGNGVDAGDERVDDEERIEEVRVGCRGWNDRGCAAGLRCCRQARRRCGRPPGCDGSAARRRWRDRLGRVDAHRARRRARDARGTAASAGTPALRAQGRSCRSPPARQTRSRRAVGSSRRSCKFQRGDREGRRTPRDQDRAWHFNAPRAGPDRPRP